VGKDTCKRCNGTGLVWDEKSPKKTYVTCPSCKGTGER
jgi:DnaJ-class molecular chaperone